jgi:glycosyltransferase involved in cell wall biosynthesis
MKKDLTPRRIRVAVITCYFLPDYVRSISIRAALATMDDVEPLVIKNTSKGVLRYPEVIAKMIWCRLAKHPDLYILEFRGQEMLPISLCITAGKPLIFDEFIVPLAWATREKHARTLRTQWFRILSRVSAPLYKRWLKACKLILTDTIVHAEISSKLGNIPHKRYRVLPVGTDETLFKPKKHVTLPSIGQEFSIFFYGLKMTPLHGLNHILAAAIVLGKSDPLVSFTIVGGDSVTEAIVQNAVQQGARVTYKMFVPFSEFAPLMHAADLCLGGPFGDTEQARSVVTGKTYQSIACGRPTVVADTKAHTQFTDEKDCLKVPLSNAQALVDKIRWAMKHPKQLQKIGPAGRALYEKEFSTKKITIKLHEIVMDAL